MAFANCANRFIMTFKTLAKVVFFDELGKWENRTSLVFTTRNARLYFSFLVSRKVHLLYRKRSFLVSRKVRFLVMAMLKRAWHCAFDLSKTFLFFVPNMLLNYAK